MKVLLLFDKYRFFNRFNSKYQYYDMVLFRLSSLLKHNGIEYKVVFSFSEVQNYINHFDIIIVDVFYDLSYLYNLLNLVGKKLYLLKNIYPVSTILENNFKLIDIFESEFQFNNVYFKENLFDYHYDESSYETYLNHPLILYSQGCDFHCSFCTLNTSKFFRNISTIVNELTYIYGKYGNKLCIELITNDILFNNKYLLMFLENNILYNISLWFNLVISNNVNSNIIKLLEEKNLVNIKSGIDHLDNSIRLIKMYKPLDVESLDKKLDLFPNNFKFDFNFIIGYVYETDKTFSNYKNEFRKFIERHYKKINKISLYMFRYNSNYNKLWVYKSNNYFKRQQWKYEMVSICKEYMLNYRVIE